MATTYLDMLAKFQEQGLDTLKQAQSAYIETLSSTRTMVEKMPAAPVMPKIEGLPTIEELTEMNTAFLDKVIEQQKAFAKDLAAVFAPISKAV